VSQFNEGETTGSLWIIQKVGDNRFTLCNTKSQFYLTVPVDPTKRNPVIQDDHWNTEGSPPANYCWGFNEVRPNEIEIVSSVGGRYLHVRKTYQQNRDAVVQWNESGDNGNLWCCERVFKNGWEAITKVPDSYSITFKELQDNNNPVSIVKKNNVHFSTEQIKFSQISETDHKLEIISMIGDDTKVEEIQYHRLTGEKISHKHYLPEN